MTPTEFDFTVKIPGDSRLIGAIRQLATHAAGYAQLAPADGERLASHVERETESAMSATRISEASIEYRFTADADALVVEFACDTLPSTPQPMATNNGGLTVEWTADGTRHVCQIRQPLK